MKFITFCKGHPRGVFIIKTLRIMRLTAVILLTFSIHLSARTSSQTISFSGKNVPLEKAFTAIEKQTGYFVLIEKELMKDIRLEDISVKDAPLVDFLQLILQHQPLKYLIKDKNILVSFKTGADLSSRLEFPPPPIRGRVLDDEGQPLAGASVTVKNTKSAGVTDAEGVFTLNVNEDDVISVSFVGYRTKDVKIGTSILNGSIINITLSRVSAQLDETQVIAYGKTSRRLSTGNISTIKAEDIIKAPVGNPLLAINGRIPGVFIQQSVGVPGSGIKISIQGQNSYLNGNDPFYVVDGVPYTPQLLPGLGDGILGTSGSPNLTLAPSTGGNPLSFINSQDIESIDVLKDADATSIYGSRAANGAIIITTKKGKIGKTNLSFNIQQGGGKIVKRANLLNTQQYIEMRKEAYANDNISIPNRPTMSNADLTFFDQNRYTDWQNELIGGVSKYTNVSATLSGGTINTQYLISGGYQK